MAVAGVWGRHWSGRLVLCHSDSILVVAQVNSLHAHNPLAAHLLQCLVLFQALFDFCLRVVHIPRSSNVGAALLSCNQVSTFLNTHPSAFPLLLPVPPAFSFSFALRCPWRHPHSGRNSSAVSGERNHSFHQKDVCFRLAQVSIVYLSFLYPTSPHFPGKSSAVHGLLGPAGPYCLYY